MENEIDALFYGGLIAAGLVSIVGVGVFYKIAYNATIDKVEKYLSRARYNFENELEKSLRDIEK